MHQCSTNVKLENIVQSGGKATCWWKKKVVSWGTGKNFSRCVGWLVEGGGRFKIMFFLD